MKTLWTSRHQLTPEALEALRELGVCPLDPRVCGGDPADCEMSHGLQCCETREVLWPAEPEECSRLLESLLLECDILAGVFPAQAQEAICLALAGQHEGPDFREMFSAPEIPIGRAIISPVSVPETEPEVKKVRPFRFVRWAWMVQT